MAIFVRNHRPPRYRDYQDFKAHLRVDFLHRCAYCLITEARWGSERNFVVEHFRPKVKFPALIRRYSNLYYACNRCNEFKGSKWPLPAMIRQGFFFADPCRTDLNAVHLDELPNGHLEPKTRCGEYTSIHLWLNRPLLVDWRVQRRMLLEDIAETQRAAELLSAQVIPALAGEARSTLEGLIQRHQDLCARLKAWY